MIPHNCAVAGAFSQKKNVASLLYYCLIALQHRGQESAGIAVVKNNKIKRNVGMGLTSSVFSEEDLKNLKSYVGIAHARYSTTGSSSISNAQPIVVGDVACAHNGNLVNYKQIAKSFGDKLKTTADSEVIALLFKEFVDNFGLKDGLRKLMKSVVGSYSVCMLYNNALIAMRDPLGFKPLSIGELEDGYVVASETCALDAVNARYLRDVDAGEVIRIDGNGIETILKINLKRKAFCMFEYVYFARPDSKINGREVYGVRKSLGRLLAKNDDVKADIVIPVPDSGICAAIGYAEASGIKYGEGLIKNRYVGRTFIMPKQKLREKGVDLKLAPIKSEIKGKRIILVDDSIVRGTTIRKIVKLLKDAGAKEVHVRISCPPITSPCFYGIDFPTKQELIAANKSVEEIRKIIKADSLKYQTIENLVKAIGIKKENLCLACLTGEYPTELYDYERNINKN